MKYLIKLLFGILLMFFGGASANEATNDLGSVDFNEYIYPKSKIFFTEKQRLQIDQGRRQFILSNPVPVDGLDVIETTVQKPTKNLPEKIMVTSIIVDPSGAKKVWLNGNFQNPQKKNWRLDLHQTTEYVAVFWLDGKRIKVPVGYTYWVQEGRLEKNYVIINKPSVSESNSAPLS